MQHPELEDLSVKAKVPVYLAPYCGTAAIREARVQEQVRSVHVLR